MSALPAEEIKTGDALAEEGQRLYDQRLRGLLEPHQNGRFVAIEPKTERYFLADTGIAALRAAKSSMPDKLFYLLRVGSDAAYRLGGYGARRR